LAVTLFFGGWQGPILPPVIWFLIKVFIFIFFFIWVRATYPRFRYDQLMKFGWKVLFPLALLNIMITAVVIVFTS
jgi:NADH-quinone oxidoreductase subunit H